MKHIFAAAGGDADADYPFKAIVRFQSSENGWCINGVNYEEIADWIEHTRKTLLLSGVSDYQTKILENDPNTPPDYTVVQFLFSSPIDCFHFRAMTEGNAPVQYPVHVSATDLIQAETRYKRIRQFAMENDLSLLMSPIFTNKFIVNPATLYDLVSVLRYLDSDKSTEPFPSSPKTCTNIARTPEVS